MTSGATFDVVARGTGSLSISDGGIVTVGTRATIAALASGSGNVTVAGADSRWDIADRLDIAGNPFFSGGQATLEVSDGAEVRAATGVFVFPRGELHMHNTGRLSGGTLSNQGLVHGNGRINNSLANSDGGEVMVITGNQLTFASAGNTNAGQITLAGGATVFQQDVTNQTDGIILGNGTLRADGGLTNDGIASFSGMANVIGRVTNSATGRIIASGGGPTTFFDDVTNNGSVQVIPNSFVVFFGSYSGNGVGGRGTVLMEGDLKPGGSTAAISFGGDLVLGQSARTQIELGGTVPGGQHDQLNVVGTASLASVLDLLVIDGYTDPAVPAAADDFVLVKAADIVGAFQTVNYEGAPLTMDFLEGDGISFRSHQGDGLFRNITYGDTTVELTNYLALDGDANGDGFVDPSDFSLWNDNRFSARTDWITGDFSGDGVTDVRDFNIWNEHKFMSVANAAARSVPEPGTGVLVLLALVSVVAVPWTSKLRIVTKYAMTGFLGPKLKLQALGPYQAN